MRRLSEASSPRMLVVILVAALSAAGCGKRPQGSRSLTKENPLKPIAVVSVGRALEVFSAAPSGRRVAVVSHPGGGLVLDLRSAKRARVAPSMLKDSTTFAFSPTGERLAIGGPGGGIRVGLRYGIGHCDVR